ncbi:hypothetical protein KQ51_00515 [Candidatus Izimaplasma bacterium HR1]|uniref:hypothetical protein n=1 Tax=Candidatus Izimoplasma sp. HR1 TaxID=1541959 RepID=UPI0004F74EB0|nr:hypothetical protein KQ51_00515 [Candidatus Izimaplasma bacterium HR1]
MRKLLNITMLVFLTILLSSCGNEVDSEITQNFVLGEIDFYLQNNDLLNDYFDTNLDDVGEKITYTKASFFNYDLKNTNNVDIEYDDYYTSFSNLIFVKQAVNEIDNFAYNTCYNETISTETVCVHYDNEVLKIEYYEHISELDVAMSHRYELTKIDGVVSMVKYMTVYDIANDREILDRKIEVYGRDYILDKLYYPETRSFVYEYTSYEDQEYFMYKGTLDSNQEFIRQTIEYYIHQFKAFVSYDIKNDLLEDYRVKLFDDGHRVLKADINVKDNNPTVNELSWNMLSVENWSTVEYILENHYLYLGNYPIMQDYEFDVQLSGYGKVTAYKMFEGDLENTDITLETYGLESGYNLSDINNAKLYFESNYVNELLVYGFAHNDPDNRLILSIELVFMDSELSKYISGIK